MSSGLLGKSQSILVFFPSHIETGHAKTFKAAGWGVWGVCVCDFGMVPDVIIVLFNDLNLSSDFV